MRSHAAGDKLPQNLKQHRREKRTGIEGGDIYCDSHMLNRKDEGQCHEKKGCVRRGHPFPAALFHGESTAGNPPDRAKAPDKCVNFAHTDRDPLLSCKAFTYAASSPGAERVSEEENRLSQIPNKVLRCYLLCGSASPGIAGASALGIIGASASEIIRA